MRKNHKQQLVLLFIACVISLVTWLILKMDIIPKGYGLLCGIFFWSIAASKMSVSLKVIAELPAIITIPLRTVVAVLGWYCPMALAAMRKFPISKRRIIFCIVVTIFIWILPILGYIASKAE